MGFIVRNMMAAPPVDPISVVVVIRDDNCADLIFIHRNGSRFNYPWWPARDESDEMNDTG